MCRMWRCKCKMAVGFKLPLVVVEFVPIADCQGEAGELLQWDVKRSLPYRRNDDRL